MQLESVIAAAKRTRKKPKLEDFRSVAAELRRKGMTWREIADFLASHGVRTNHVAVFRLLRPSLAIPIETTIEGQQGGVIVGGELYEANPRGLARPFSAARAITIERKIRVIVLENRVNASAIWCEMQFRLNERPADEWIRTLATKLHGQLTGSCVIRTPNKARLTFEGADVGIQCWRIEIKACFEEFKNAVHETNLAFAKPARLKEEFREADKKWRELVTSVYDEDPDEAVEGHIEHYAKIRRETAREFEGLVV